MAPQCEAETAMVVRVFGWPLRECMSRQLAFVHDGAFCIQIPKPGYTSMQPQAVGLLLFLCLEGPDSGLVYI